MFPLPVCFQDSSLITVPPFGGDGGAKGTLKGNTGTWASGQGSFGQGTLKTGLYKPDVQDFYSSQFDNQYGTQQFSRDYLMDGGMGGDSRYLAQNSSFHHTWQTNGRYLQQVKTPGSFCERSQAVCLSCARPDASFTL